MEVEARGVPKGGLLRNVVLNWGVRLHFEKIRVSSLEGRRSYASSGK